MLSEVAGPLRWRPMSDNPPYQAIADQLRAEILAGTWDRPDVPFPGARAVGDRFGVSIHTASRAIQQLAAQGLLVTKGGQRPLVVHPDERSTAWPLTRRYARARAAQGLVFAADVPGDMRKATISRRWVLPPPAVARLLRVDPGVDVFRRVSRTYLGDRPVEDTAMHFPPAVVADIPGLATDEQIQVVRLIEATGRKITRTRQPTTCATGLGSGDRSPATRRPGRRVRAHPRNVRRRRRAPGSSGQHQAGRSHRPDFRDL